MENDPTADTTEQRFLRKYETLLNIRYFRKSERDKKILVMTGDRDACFAAPKVFEDYQVIIEEVIEHKIL